MSGRSSILRSLRWTVQVSRRSLHPQRFWLALLVGWSVLTLLYLTDVAGMLERSLLDLRLRLRPNFYQQVVPVRVALLDARDQIDDTAYFQHSLALLQALASPQLPAEQRPQAVAFATPFLRSPDVLQAQALVNATRALPRTVQAIQFNPDGRRLRNALPEELRGWPLPPEGASLRRATAVMVPHSAELAGLLPSAYAIGFVNLAEDENRLEVVRSIPVVMRYQDRVYPSLGLAAAMAALDLKSSQVILELGHRLLLKPTGLPPIEVPLDARGDTLLNFRPTLGRMQAHSAWSPPDFSTPSDRVVSTQAPEEMLAKLLPGGRLLLVGDPRRVVHSPLGSNIPVVNVHAQLATDILSGDFLRQVPVWLDFGLGLVVLTLLALYLGLRDPQGLGGVWMGFGLGFSHGTTSLVVFALGPYWLQLAPVGLALFFAVLVDGIFLHRYLNQALARVRQELDALEKQALSWGESLQREEAEQSRRLEQIQREETLAQTILSRQELRLARALTSGGSSANHAPFPVKKEGEPSPPKPSESLLKPARQENGPESSLEPTRELDREFSHDPHSGLRSPLTGHQPLLIQEVSRRYRAHVKRLEQLLVRYRQLLDQVLMQLEVVQARQPVVLPSEEPEGFNPVLAEELVTRTGVMTRDPHLLQLLHQVVMRIGPNDRTTVLIHGESGTGKELIARAIHRSSPRARQPFVALNCAAIPEGLIESELFGHMRGAFSGAARDRRGAFLSAQEGVLFLDELGDAPAHIQVKLLRALQERRIRPVGSDADVAVDVRIVAATHQDLRARVRAGTFREDLFHRLHVVPLELPALRQRRGDVAFLAQHFLAREAKVGGTPRQLSEGALQRLCQYSWPGNVRELENCMLALGAMSVSEVIGEDEVIKALGGRLEAPERQHGADFSEADLRWLSIFRRHRFQMNPAVADPEAPAHNRQTGYRHLMGLCCKALYLADWRLSRAARLLAGPEEVAEVKALAKLKTYRSSLVQALESKDMARFKSEWRRYLGDDFFYVQAALEALQAGRLAREDET